jgi:hypothetical protein
MKKQATYRMVRFDLPNQPARYVGIAWNYDQAVLIATKDHESYVSAKSELSSLCADRAVELAWFDGEYVRHPGDDMLHPV